MQNIKVQFDNNGGQALSGVVDLRSPHQALHGEVKVRTELT